jgi:hypothetical protein
MKTILAILLILALGYIMSVFLSRPLFYWGHHFNFENELGFKIDSLEVSVGGVKTIIISSTDSLPSLEGNIDVPKTGYPHEVVLTIYSNEKSSIMKVDSFNCYNCDGNHQYTLTKSGARYRFSP